MGNVKGARPWAIFPSAPTRPVQPKDTGSPPLAAIFPFPENPRTKKVDAIPVHGLYKISLPYVFFSSSKLLFSESEPLQYLLMATPRRAGTSGLGGVLR